jgi:hypothetical protein
MTAMTTTIVGPIVRERSLRRLARRTEDAVLYTREHFEDPAEILDRTWIDD